MKLSIALGAVLLLGASVAVQAGPEDTAPYGKQVTSIATVAKSRPGSFDVYIDKPTGFAFVHTPSGWKFTRSVRDRSSAAGATIAAAADKI